MPTGGFLAHAAIGNAEPLFLALVLAGFAAALADRHGWALSLGALAARYGKVPDHPLRGAEGILYPRATPRRS